MAAARVKARAGQRLQRAGQGRHERQALRRLRPARGRARLQHDRHVASRGCATSTCRRSRRRSTPGADTVDVLVQRHQRRRRAARTSTTETDILKKRVGLRRLHRERLHGGRRAAPARRRTRRAVRPRHRRRRPDAAAAALNAGTDSEMVSTYLRDYGEQLLASGRISMARHRRRRAPDPAREVPRRAVRAPVRRPRRKADAAQLLPRRRRGGPQGGRALDGAAQERRQRRCRSTRA